MDDQRRRQRLDGEDSDRGQLLKNGAVGGGRQPGLRAVADAF
jgi:hypothetical protein